MMWLAPESSSSKTLLRREATSDTVGAASSITAHTPARPQVHAHSRQDTLINSKMGAGRGAAPVTIMRTRPPSTCAVFSKTSLSQTGLRKPLRRFSTWIEKKGKRACMARVSRRPRGKRHAAGCAQALGSDGTPRHLVAVGEVEHGALDPARGFEAGLDLVVDARPHARHPGQDGGAQRGNVVHQLAHVALVKADGAPKEHEPNHKRRLENVRQRQVARKWGAQRQAMSVDARFRQQKGARWRQEEGRWQPSHLK